MQWAKTHNVNAGTLQQIDVIGIIKVKGLIIRQSKRQPCPRCVIGALRPHSRRKR
ncbi:Uncharacterised protein [Salmonella enterica subsp. enterica serovar Bovismorbificans]|uniref:Uncharacterized protein n=1 Tax=Salmonella enterica subsp. enterica serovar Bovismorbificans TaxID=58097 RepID=A0A655D1Y9_SALET|nr:Uncharacterised protein [Salmonella enterica subsp. enterica serovar Bovismorbificans]